MTRREWQAAIRKGGLPAGERIMRGTLLSLPMTSDGRVIKTDEEISAATGLPVRTVCRHLARAVAAGWLHRESRGGNGVRCRFTATVPPAPAVRHFWPTAEGQEYATSGDGSTPESTYSAGSGVRHLVANINKDRASVSEHGALVSYRERQINHDGARDEPNHDETKSSIDEEASRLSMTVQN